MDHSKLPLIDTSSIIVPDNRQRQDFPRDKLLELAESIRDNQLINPISIRSLEDRTLVTGERRYRVLNAFAKKGLPITFNNQELPPGIIPVNLVGNLPTLDAEILELDENLKRENLTWQEEAQAIARLQRLRTEQKQLSDPEAKPVTNKEIADEKDINPAKVSEAINIAKHLDDPEVAGAKNIREAQKIVHKKAKKLERYKNAELADISASRHTLILGDCTEKIKDLDDDQFTCIVTDPPYGIDMHKDQSWDGSYHEYDDTEDYAFNLIKSLTPEWDRVCKSKAHLYMFCDYSKFSKLRALIESYRYDPNDPTGRVGFMSSWETVYRHNEGFRESKICSKTKPIWEVMYFPLIWNKGNIASYPRPDHWPRKSYECILYAIKGNYEHNKLDLAVINIDQIRDQDHEAGKPMELYKHLLNRSCVKGDKALDCFAGQGNIFRACQELSLTGTGIEMSEDKYYPLAKLTLQELIS